MKKVSIQVKLAVAILGCLLLLAGANVGVASMKYQDDMKFAGEQAVKASAQSFAAHEKQETDKLSTALDALMGEPAFASFFSLRERERLLEAAQPVFQTLKERHSITHWYFLDPAPARTCFLRVHRPEQHDDVVNRATLLAAIRTNEVASGKELGQTAFALRVVRPYVYQGKLLGYMEVGQEIDSFLTEMKNETGDDYALVVDKKNLDEKAWAKTRGERRNNWADDPEMVAVNVTHQERPVTGAAADLKDIPDGGRVVGTVETDGHLYLRGVVPVRDAAGNRVGGLFVLRDVTALRDRLRGDQIRGVLLMGGVAILVLGLIFVLVEWLVFRRINRLKAAMEGASVRLAGGDYDVAATLHPEADDELGRFERFLAGFLGMVGTTLKDVEQRARRATP